MRNICSNSQPFLQIKSSSININSSNRISILKSTDLSCQIKCLTCSMILNVFYSKGNGYSQFINKSKRFSRMSLPLTTTHSDFINSIPRPLKSYFIIESQDIFSLSSPIISNISREGSIESINDINEDEDFNLMFSNNTERFVGSYTDSPTLSFDPSLLFNSI